MSVGMDTTWLMEVALREHVGHESARATLERLTAAAEIFVVVPQVLCEFVLVATDGRRFQNPLSMDKAIDLAQRWWNAESVRQVFPTLESVQLGWLWMRQFQLGRKRILDAQLAATFHVHGITRILTSNARDYRIFECFEVV